MRRIPHAALWATLAVLAACTFLAIPSRAQIGPPPPDEKDLPLTAKTRNAVIDSLVTQLHRRYVFPKVADELDRTIRARQKRGEFDSITSSRAFASTLTALLHEVGKDKHFAVLYRERPFGDFDANGTPDSTEQVLFAEIARLSNYGFESARRLAGNVGYLELRSFQYTGEQAGRAATSAMNLLAHTDALIIDLRRNGGGDPSIIQLVTTYLFADEDVQHLNDLVFRAGGTETVTQFYTLPWVPGTRYVGRPVYVLIGRRTGSAAEEFAYNLQALHRATLVGATTAGAANPGQYSKLDDHFAAFISDGRARNPVTNTNWEGVGVKPDVPAETGEATRVAHLLAIQKLQEGAASWPDNGFDRGDYLKRALETAKTEVIEPLDSVYIRRGAH